jgi:hypothetical protein
MEPVPALAGFSRKGMAAEISMLWQSSRRSALRRTLKLHRAVGRPMNLEELFQGYERTLRRPRTKGRGEKERSPERK